MNLSIFLLYFRSFSHQAIEWQELFSNSGFGVVFNYLVYFEVIYFGVLVSTLLSFIFELVVCVDQISVH